VEVFAGDYTAARTAAEESLAIGRAAGYNLSISLSLEGLATVVALQGDPAHAARLWGAAEARREAMETPLPPVYRADYAHAVAAARAQLGEQAFAAAWAEGRAIPPEYLSDTQPGLSLIPSNSRPVTSTEQEGTARFPASAPLVSASLTPREREVLCLVAQGLTSAQMAEQLVIGVATVNFHVRSIYSKLGITSRAAATRYALEHHLG
jgi:DNA-binding CsgD family transcriptional regulator